jgi:thioredoxin reductase
MDAADAIEAVEAVDAGDDLPAVDYLIVGAGPAGLQLGWCLQQAGHDHLILEAGSTPGTFYRTYPRHRRMISINKVHTGWDDPELNLRMDWNSLLSDDPELLFTRYTGEYFPDAGDYVRYLTDYATRSGLPVVYDSRVTRIARDSGGRGFLVTDQRGRTRRAARVIVATGFGAAFVPPIPGIEATERYDDVSVDPDDFTGQRVLIIGKGNSAFETADNIIERAAVIHLIGPNSLKFAWKTHFIGHLRAVNNNFLDTYQLKSQNMVLDATVDRIERDGDRFLVTLSYSRRNRTDRLHYDRVITCTGFRMDTSIFDPSCRPEMTVNGRLPALTPAWESVNVPGLYVAGTLTQSRDFKKHTSAFIHGFRYGVRSLSRILARRYEGTPWPHRPVPAEPGALAAAVLDRVNRSSGLWQQYAFLCDLIELPPAGGDGDGGGSYGRGGDGRGPGVARYQEEIPVDHVLDRSPGGFGAPDRFLMVTLEYGAGHDTIDPFDVEVGRRWEEEHPHEDRYLHPVVRYFEGHRLVARLPLPEDLCNDWSGERSHQVPLRQFLAGVLTTGGDGTGGPNGAGTAGGAAGGATGGAGAAGRAAARGNE